MFRIKICGVTRAEDVEAVVDAGADALGLNFYPQSRRYLKHEPSDRFLAALQAAQSSGCQLVGVFVNENPSEILRRRSQYSLDWVQLHGDEPIDFANGLPGVRILRAMGYGESGLSKVVGQLDAMEAAGCGPEAVLLDALDPVQFGGTGRELPWSRLQSELSEGGRLSVPWVLAGGLKASNVQEAIRAVNPNAVDVASGVESSAGIKDHEKIRAFVREARAGWVEVESRVTVRRET